MKFALLHRILNNICVSAARAVGGGLLAIDVLEDPQRGYLVNEVNHTMEFHTLAPVTGINIAGVIIDYTLAVARGQVNHGLPDALPVMTYSLPTIVPVIPKFASL